MPLKLVPPRQGKTPYWYVRGSYLRVRVNRSTGAIAKRAARAVLARWERAIERGEYAPAPQPALTEPAEPTFAVAALAYLRAGGERKHLSPIIEMTGAAALRHLPLSHIDQIVIDNAAAALYPAASAQTRNRQFYTPVSAVLKHAGMHKPIKRPKGWRGSKATSWLRPEQAFALFAEADTIDTEFGLLCRVLLYTGMRISEALRVTLGDVDLQKQSIYLPRTKNDDPRSVYLPTVLIAALANQPPRPARPRKSDGRPLHDGEAGRSRTDAGVPFLERADSARLFRFHQGGHLRGMLAKAMDKAGLSFPRRQRGFHLFCHTYGSWMHGYGGLDTFALTRTGRWQDPRSADRYKHTEVSEEARRADLLPVGKTG